MMELYIGLLLFFFCGTHGEIIVDTDCGGDDAMAIFALAKAQWDDSLVDGPIIGFTTVSGNTGATNASFNVDTVRYVIGAPFKTVPFFKGGEDSLTGPARPTFWFGQDGLGDFLTGRPKSPAVYPDMTAPQFIISQVTKLPGKVHILAIGPLTNLALAIQLHPGFFNDVKHVTILGATYRGGGNWGPGTEANMYSDPDAASYFFSKVTNFTKVTVVPEEAVSDIQFPMKWRREELGSLKSHAMEFLNKAEKISLIKYGSVYPVYDPSAAALLVVPELAIERRNATIRVVTEGPRGATFTQLDSAQPNAMVVTRLDQPLLKAFLTHYLRTDVNPSWKYNY